ncbi:MAG: transpeptidase family protein [Flavobacteriaceae bacterium]|nr:transpeptidase family protein [Flavobacteriaceae bacterium]
MAAEKKNILSRLYIFFVFLTLFFIAIIFKLTNIQYVEGDRYRSLSIQRTIKNDTIQANRGNVYADDGSLLATSMSRYEIRMDASKPDDSKVFEENIQELSVELSKMLGKTSDYYVRLIRKARNRVPKPNRYLLIARNIGYLDYQKMKAFPIFNLGMYKGGFIAEQSTKREHPLGKIAERTIGYDDYRGAPGIEGAYKKHLKGGYGVRRKQRIAQGQWKPISDNNEVEPQDGRDVITTINVNMQDIAHHSLLRQLEYYEAEHGCVVVMETKTGEIKAISNLGRGKSGKYYEKRNYAIWESHEPGSAFKLMSMVAALELKAIDSSTVVDTGTGKYRIYGRSISDSHEGGYGKISAARALEVSSNIAFARLIDENFNKNPNKFINQLKKMHLNERLGLPLKGEGIPNIPAPGDEIWSKNALPSIAYGYNLSLTPLQILTFYNAIANNGEMVKPRLVKEIRSWDKKVKVFEKEVIDSKICSDATISKVQEMLKNVVVRGTGKKLYDANFSMAGKTGTARTEYRNFEEWKKDRKYISSFTGYFPADNPKYSCIVVIHKPNLEKGYYGADVSGPVFKDIAQKIYTDAPLLKEIINKEPQFASVDNDFEKYNKASEKQFKTMPNVTGMVGMDAVSLLENLGLKVTFIGNGKVRNQSIKIGEKVVKGAIIKLELA